MRALGGVPRDRRLGFGGALALVLVVVIVLLVAAGGSSGPDDGAAQLVPADALAYVNVSLDSARLPVRRLAALAGRAPQLAGIEQALVARLGAIVGTGDFAAAARTWIGDEAALAVLPPAAGGNQAGSLILVAARRLPAARRFLATYAADQAPVVDRGVRIDAFSGGAYGTLVGRFVVFGQEAEVRAAVAVSRGAASLASAGAYQQAASGETADRVLDAFATRAGIEGLLGGRAGLAGAAESLLAVDGARAVGASVLPAPGGVRIQIHRVFGRSHQAGGAVSVALLRRVPAGSDLALEMGSLPAAAPDLLAATSRLGIGSAIGPLLTRLGSALHAEGAHLGTVLPLFERDAVLALTGGAAHPALLVLGRTEHPRTARVQLAELEPPLAALFPAAARGPGVAPLFTSRRFDGLTVHELALGPGLQVDYATAGHVVAISTGLRALAALAGRSGGLTSTSRYRVALHSAQGEYGSVLFADPELLIRLGERAGLLGRGGSSGFLSLLRLIPAVGLRSTGGQTDSTTELYLEIK